jgi:adhesin/invasin
MVPRVLVTSATGAPVVGATVVFSVKSGGGTVSGASALSDPEGLAGPDRWTLGPGAGIQLLSATVSGLPAAQINATATPATAASLSIGAGDAQTATVSTAVALAPEVIVRDRFANPVPGVSVVYSVVSGGGTLTGATVVSDGAGLARLGSWVLGPTAGPNLLQARVAGIPAASFSATATAGAPATVVIAAGDLQLVSGGTAVPIAPGVIVRDANSNPVAGVTVTFVVASGGGSLTGAAPVTGLDGIATVGSWTLGTTAGVNTLTAAAGVLAPVTFTATGTAGAPASVAINAGEGQTATAGTAVSIPPSVVVRDAHGKPVPSVSVSFAVASGGGSVTGAAPVTGLDGIAMVGSWTLGAVPGTNTLTATVNSLPPLTFTATGIASASAYNIELQQVGSLTAPAAAGLYQCGDPVAPGRHRRPERHPAAEHQSGFLRLLAAGHHHPAGGRPADIHQRPDG